MSTDVLNPEPYESRFEETKQSFLSRNPDLKDSPRVDEAVDFLVEHFGTVEDLNNEEIHQIMLDMAEHKEEHVDSTDYEESLQKIRHLYQENPEQFKDIEGVWDTMGDKNESFETVLQTNNDISRFVSDVIDFIPEKDDSKKEDRPFSRSESFQMFNPF